MANELDEITGLVNDDGRDVKVIEKQLKVELGRGTEALEIAVWVVGFIFALLLGLASAEGVAGVAVMVLFFGAVPGLLWEFLKVTTRARLLKIQQRIQANASQVDNYLEQRVIILENLAGLLSKSIDLDKDVMKTIAAYRSGINLDSDADRNTAGASLDRAFLRINVAVEAYPELRSQENIAEAMRQNAYLQKEITAARALHNETVMIWNQQIYSWPIGQIVASKAGYTTRIPFTVSQEMRDAARKTFF